MPPLDLLASIVEGTPDPIFVKDLEGRMVLLNSACARVLGYPKAWLLGKQSSDYLASGFAKPIEAVDRRVLSTGVTEVVEESLVQDGEIRIFLSTKSAWIDSNGAILGLIGIARDITDRKRAEQAHRESQDRLNQALEAGLMGTWDFNLKTGYLEWSDGHFRLFGMEPGECTPTSELFTSRLEPADRERVDAVVAKAIANREDFSVSYRVVWADGGTHWLEARGQVVVNSGEVVRTVGIVSDMTSRKRTEDKVREAAKLESLGVLAGGIAHDFNNLLQGVLGNASLIVEQAAPGSEISVLALGVVEASERAANLTRQMLAYSGRGHFVIEPLDLSQEVVAIATLLKASIPKTVQLDLGLAPCVPAILADRGQIQQVVMNLVLNAAESIPPEGGTISLRTGARLPREEDRLNAVVAEPIQPGEYVFLEVQDTGHGMTAETKNRIFDPFFTTKFTGRGLGLAAVLGIVRGHGGIIQVHSNPGSGTLFSVLVPSTAESVNRDCGPQEFAEAAKQGEAILIVDDEEIVRRMAALALQRHGYRVEFASNGEEAVSVLRVSPERIVAVLLDMTMPVIGGADALQLLRKLRPRIAFIASSGFAEAEVLSRFGDGITAYIQKPYLARDLVATIGNAIAKAASARDRR